MADGIIFRTEDLIRWGAAGGLGTGGNLTPLQFDENMWVLLTRIQALENDPPEAISITGFTVIGSQFQVNMSDASTRGPYDLPIAEFHDQGEWTNDLPLAELDLISSPGVGLYLVKIAHTTPASPAVFDPEAVDEEIGSPTIGQPLYQLLFGSGGGANQDVPFFIAGFPGTGFSTGDIIQGFVVTHASRIPIDLAGSIARLGSPSDAGDGDVGYEIKVNGVVATTALFLEDEVISEPMTMATAIDLVAGDMITLTYPDTGISASAKNLFLTIVLQPL